jgi:polysaccharide biosynthesis protein PelA
MVVNILSNWIFRKVVNLCCVIVVAFCVTLISTSKIQASGVEPKANLPIARVIYSLYDKKIEKNLRTSFVHRIAEMPLNWLGYHTEYYEINEELPKWRDDVAGVLLWLPYEAVMPDMKAYVAWLDEAMKLKKKIIIMGNIGFSAESYNNNDSLNDINRLMGYLGLSSFNQWVSVTYNAKVVYKDPRMIEYERKYPTSLKGFPIFSASPETKVYLRIKGIGDANEELQSDLVTTNENGGYVAEDYGVLSDYNVQAEQGIAMQRWYINPFLFFSRAMGAKNNPKPDLTTLYGRRIFYSHLDGDGWNNYSEVYDNKKDPVIAARVLYEEIYKKYPQIPFTVAPITAELEDSCYARADSAKAARDIFALSNTEPATHTHTHPLMWTYFDNMHPAAELKYFSKYPAKSNSKSSIFDILSKSAYDMILNVDSWKEILDKYSTEDIPANPLDKIIAEDYQTPRSYACEPFDMRQEIAGSADFINDLAPSYKKTKLVQWSGDTMPSENALSEARIAGLYNINGGDSRYDPIYPSYSYVAPIGLKIGDYRQIYSSNSNENTYTSLWSDKFFGFKYLINTVNNTETPIRVSPFNIYYHSYSAEKKESLQSLIKNFDFALSRSIIPIFTSEYAAIANGYYTTEIVPVGIDAWQINNRGALETIRFDDAVIKMVDFEASKGVIGQKHYQGSLYVSLNPDVKSPIIKLKNMDSITKNPPSALPYLIDSRWSIRDWKMLRNGISLKVQGFGKGVVRFYWPISKKVNILVKIDNKLLQKKLVDVNDNLLKISLKHSNNRLFNIDIIVR